MANRRFPFRSVWFLFALIMMFGVLGLSPLVAQSVKTYKVFIVSDTWLDKFVELSQGFKASLDKQLMAADAKAEYTLFDTKLDPATVPGIISAIKEGKPDLICTINWPSSFADRNIALKLPESRYRFVSLNAIPVQSGAAKTWQKPGGNITGVGVFLQFDSMIRIAKKIDPGIKRLYFFTWGAMQELSTYFESEITAACKREKIELAEFKLVNSAEEEFEYLAKIDQTASKAMVVGGISAWVHRDGSAADMAAEEGQFFQTKINRLPFFAYDETSIKYGWQVGTCVVWYDIGGQLGDQGYKLLAGGKPGDLAWQYPRSYNLMFNLAKAKQTGLKIPESLLSAAYRVYIDYSGNFIGQKN